MTQFSRHLEILHFKYFILKHIHVLLFRSRAYVHTQKKKSLPTASA